MNERLARFIKFSCGRQSVFAERMGWTRTYVSKLIRGVGFGITPVVAILSTFPELEARWLLLGEGDMLRGADENCCGHVRAAFSHLSAVMEALGPSVSSHAGVETAKIPT